MTDVTPIEVMVSSAVKERVGSVALSDIRGQTAERTLAKRSTARTAILRALRDVSAG